jgi:hypothetical protein
MMNGGSIALQGKRGALAISPTIVLPIIYRAFIFRFGIDPKGLVNHVRGGGISNTNVPCGPGSKVSSTILNLQKPSKTFFKELNCAPRYLLWIKTAANHGSARLCIV